MGTYAYGKIGRAIALTSDGWGIVGGDSEPPRLLRSLALRNPQDTFVIISTCRDNPQECGYPRNVINAWTPERLTWYKNAVAPYQQMMKQVKKTDPAMLDAIRGIEGVIDALLLPLTEKIDGMVLWAGQHGTANSVLPAVTGRSGIPGFTRPYDSFVFYAGGIFRMLNAWRDQDPTVNEEVWLIADTRNHLKARDIKWPPTYPVLGQFDMVKTLHHERFGDARDPKFIFHTSRWKTSHTWVSPVDYIYSGIEVCSLDGIRLPPSPTSMMFNSHQQRRSFGIFINEAGQHTGQGKDQVVAGRLQRAPIVRDWVLPLEPAFIHGKWTDASQAQLGITVTPAPWGDFFDIYSSVRSTLTTPSSGSGWATTKPWEAFASGTVCFRHPEYDTQNHIYGQLPNHVNEWLSPPTKEDLWARVEYLDRNPQTWQMLMEAQYELFEETMRKKRWLATIEDRLHRA